MSPAIEYETADGTNTIIRDECSITEITISAFDNPDEPGVKNKVTFPRERVVRIDG